MYESKIISERARKSASAPRGSNWFNTLLGQMTKKHPAWGWKEICAALEKKALKNSNVNNSIYEVDDEYVIWTDQRGKERKVLITSLPAIISRRKHLK
jgi:hypothetical protein